MKPALQWIFACKLFIYCFIAVDAFWLVMVAILWGATNPFLKRGGEGIEKIKKDGVIQQFLAEIFFLIFNWKVSLGQLISTTTTI